MIWPGDGPGLRVLVTGGRDYVDIEQAYEVLDRIHLGRGIILLIHGKARGADTICGRWARARNVEEKACPANWDGHGLSAGIRRNKAMLLLKPDMLVAFPGGPGTADMVARAEKSRLYIHRVPERSIPMEGLKLCD